MLLQILPSLHLSTLQSGCLHVLANRVGFHMTLQTVSWHCVPTEPAMEPAREGLSCGQAWFAEVHCLGQHRLVPRTHADMHPELSWPCMCRTAELKHRIPRCKHLNEAQRLTNHRRKLPRSAGCTLIEVTVLWRKGSLKRCSSSLGVQKSKS